MRIMFELASSHLDLNFFFKQDIAGFSKVRIRFLLNTLGGILFILTPLELLNLQEIFVLQNISKPIKIITPTCDI